MIDTSAINKFIYAIVKMSNIKCVSLYTILSYIFMQCFISETYIHFYLATTVDFVKLFWDSVIYLHCMIKYGTGNSLIFKSFHIVNLFLALNTLNYILSLEINTLIITSDLLSNKFP